MSQSGPQDTRTPLEAFVEITAAAENIALATCVEGVPNVRIVSFVQRTERPEILYFATEPGDPKVAEFAINNRVAFTTLTIGGIEHVRSRKATVEKSAHGLDELTPLFVAKISGYDEALNHDDMEFVVYEVHTEETRVIRGYDKGDLLRF